MKYNWRKLSTEEINNIKISELSTVEFSNMLRHSQLRSLSPFAQFTCDLNGYKLMVNGRDVSKWEAFYITKNASLILSGNSRVKAVKKHDIIE